MMTDSPKCLKCGGTDLTAGKLSGAFFPVSVFRPEAGGLASYKNHALAVILDDAYSSSRKNGSWSNCSCFVYRTAHLPFRILCSQ